MERKLINEDISNMKYLFGYKPGRVISEQEHLELEESNPFRHNDGFEDYNFPDKLKDRLSDIYDLLDEVMDDPDNDPSDYSDMYDFADVIISQVIHKLRDEFGEDFEEYEDDVDDYLRNNEDEYIFDFYNSNSDFGGDEDDDEDNLFEQEEPETDRYMFFSNLQQIHRQMGILLEKDPEMISEILENGHDWAQDHIATAKESIDQVFDFIMNEEEGDGDGEEMFEGYEYDDVDELNPDDFNDDEESRVNDLKQKHGIKFRKDFEGSDDEFMDYLYDNQDSIDNFRKDNNRIKIPTDPIVFDPTDDETSQLKQKHGVKFRDEFDGDDEFMDYMSDNTDSFNNLSRDLNNLRQTKRNR